MPAIQNQIFYESIIIELSKNGDIFMAAEHIYQQKPWLAFYPEGVGEHIEIPQESIVTIFDREAEKSPKTPAIIFYGKKISYGDLKAESDRFANALLKLGIKKGDRIGLLLLNSPQYVIAMLGALRIGAIVTPISPVYVSSEIKHQLEDSGARTVISLDILYEAIEKAGVELDNVILTNISEYLPKLKKIAGSSVLSGVYQQMKTPVINIEEKKGFHSFQNLIRSSEKTTPDTPIEQADIATLHYTGGTTGLPKGVMLTHANMSAALVQNLALYPFLKRGEETFIAYMPLYHIAGQWQITCSICFGWTSIIFTTPDVEEILKCISTYKATFFGGAPTVFELLKTHEKTGRVKWEKLKIILGGADTLHEHTVKDWQERTGTRIVEMYGMTESTGVTHANPLAHARINSFGIPVPNTDAAVADPEADTLLEPGEIGEHVVRGPQIMKGYWENPEATNEVMAEIDGVLWYRTGDLVRMDTDGFFHFYDRKRDLIKYKGYRVYARDVEEVLRSHPQVKEAGVVGIPDARVGEYVKAFVVPESDARGRISEQDVKEFLNGKLAHYKIPSVIEFVGEIPKTDVGKVSRRELRFDL